ncbi:MAG TPA: hypothetical protein VFI27_21235, partial [candidate division Zixibacteria bacterium]|nr:hypothetical protein [candidate division Zixibacteria bacterium]
RALKPATLDYTTFVHLVDEQGNLVTQSDSIPDNGSSPTHIWRSGDVIRDTHTLTANAPTAGSLLIGAYDLETLTRLAANIDEVPLVDDVYRLQLPQSGNYITTLHSRIHRHKPPFPNTRNFRPGSQIFWHIESSKQLPVEPSGLSLPWPLGPRATGCRIDFC